MNESTARRPGRPLTPWWEGDSSDADRDQAPEVDPTTRDQVDQGDHGGQREQGSAAPCDGPSNSAGDSESGALRS